MLIVIRISFTFIKILYLLQNSDERMLPKPMFWLPPGRGRIGKQKFETSNEEAPNERNDDMAGIPIFITVYWWQTVVILTTMFYHNNITYLS